MYMGIFVPDKYVDMRWECISLRQHCVICNSTLVVICACVQASVLRCVRGHDKNRNEWKFKCNANILRISIFSMSIVLLKIRCRWFTGILIYIIGHTKSWNWMLIPTSYFPAGLIMVVHCASNIHVAILFHSCKIVKIITT